MCGICGFVSNRSILVEQLKDMNDTMAHRGPDDSGEELYSLGSEYTLGLAQRRLSILDLSSLGHQPMHSANGRISLVYNGEIYNYREIREELPDYEFQSNCDTEVIIAAYLKWGIQCIHKFNGMFAIALFDRDTDTLYLVRDRIGKKPLYYWQDGDNIVFASECKPILKTPGFLPKLKQQVIGAYLYRQYIQAPNTVFEDVYKLEPGTVLEYHYGEYKKYKYWDIKERYKDGAGRQVKDYEEAKTTLKELLLDATKKRLISDVPLGCFLSGGYDSSLIAAMAQSISEKPLRTFSIGFDVPQFNEAEYAKAVADYLGTEHTELYVREQDMFEVLDSIAEYYDEPFADSSQIPMMLVSKLAKKQVSVALSGDGGDEFFCGYNMYEPVRTIQKLDIPGGIVYSLCRMPGIRKADLLAKLPYSVRTVALNRSFHAKTQFGMESYAKAIRKLCAAEEDFLYYSEAGYPHNNWQITRMLLDQDTYLPGDILCKVDRASMKYSLEARCPILDYRVMEYSYRIPHRFKYNKGDKKHILKDVAYSYVPKGLLDRPKTGFAVPLDKWLRGPLKERLIDYAQPERLRAQGIFDSENMQTFLQDYLKNGDRGAHTGVNYFRIMWSFLVFQQWYEKYLL